MTAPQWTFALVTVALTATGTVMTYPGVRAHAKSPAHSMLAALMASALVALPVAMFAAGVVNTVRQGGLP